MSLKPLSRNQERRLVNFLEHKFTYLTRNVRIRSQPTSTLQTIPQFLNATSLILSLVLQIPPVQPSASLRTTMLLRLTNEILENVPGYLPEPDVLPLLLDFLDDLDQAWVVVLRGTVWKPRQDEDEDDGFDEEEDTRTMSSSSSSLLTQTEKTRLRSLLRGASERFEDWLVENDPTERGERERGRVDIVHPGFGQLFMKALEELDGPEDGMDVD